MQQMTKEWILMHTLHDDGNDVNERMDFDAYSVRWVKMML